IVDRKAARPELTRQSLREHLDGPFGGRVGRHAGDEHALAHARADHDDSPAGLQVLERRLRRDEDAADVDRKDAIEVPESGLLDRHRNGRAGVVHQHVEPARVVTVLSTAFLTASASAASAWIASPFPPPRSISLTTDAAASAPLE